MGYDDMKVHGGRAYSGMRVGGAHDWTYQGRWREEKMSPDQWAFTFDATKQRRRAAPVGSGAPEGTNFHWFIMAHQRVRKLDQDTYATFMEGTKWKVAHRRPRWSRWSSEYPEQTRARRRVIEILEETARALRGQAEEGAPRLETALEPGILRDALARTLEEFSPREEEPTPPPER